MTSRFHITEGKQALIKDNAQVTSSLPVDCKGGEVCRLQLHLVYFEYSDAQCTRQEAQLLQRDRATRYVSQLVLYFTRYVSSKGFKQQNVTFKVIQGHWQWYHSISHTRFPINVPLQLCLYLAPLTIYYHLYPKS